MTETRKRKRFDLPKEQTINDTIEATKSGFQPKYFYHLAHKSNLDHIKVHGLLSTKLLLDELDLSGEEKKKIVCEHRPKNVILSNNIVIRDQSPMPPNALSKTLPSGFTSSDWYQLMNSFVFLWPDLERVERHRNAHGKDSQLVLMIFDAEKMIQDLGDQIYVSPINGGFALRKAAQRSPETFVPIHDFIKSGWPIDSTGKKRSRSSQPVEITVKDRLALEPYLLRIE